MEEHKFDRKFYSITLTRGEIKQILDSLEMCENDLLAKELKEIYQKKVSGC